jgi:AcrR family transcriptional regulator
MSTTGPGLRERKKQETRAALSWAALRLAVERGLENFLVEDIAAEVGVSTRTYNNYFSSKAEAIVWRHLDRARQTAARLRERPAGEPLWEAVAHAILPAAGDENAAPDPEWTAGVRLMISEPALQGEFLKASALADRECAVAIAERTGLDAERDMYPRLVAAAVGAAIQIATDQWLRADPPVPLPALVRDALGQIAAGLPTPKTTPETA